MDGLRQCLGPQPLISGNKKGPGHPGPFERNPIKCAAPHRRPGFRLNCAIDELQLSDNSRNAWRRNKRAQWFAVQAVMIARDAEMIAGLFAQKDWIVVPADIEAHIRAVIKILLRSSRLTFEHAHPPIYDVDVTTLARVFAPVSHHGSL